MAKKNKIIFSDKYHPIMGILSCIIAFIGLLCMIALFIISTIHKGNAGAFCGYIGLACMLMCLIGVIISIRLFNQDDIYMSTPFWGLTINGILTLGYMGMYIYGVF